MSANHVSTRFHMWGLLATLLLLTTCTSPSILGPVLSYLQPTSTSTPTMTPTQTPTSTSTPTMTPTQTPTSTSTPTPTAIPVYTDLGQQAINIADLLGWNVVTCGGTQVAEDLDHGIFLYRDDRREFFRGFSGNEREPVPEKLPQYILQLLVTKGLEDRGYLDGLHFVVLESQSIFMPKPSEVYAEDYVRLLGVFSSLAELRLHMPSYGFPARMWPLSTNELEQLRDLPHNVHP
jgi:hypothetical protein